MGTKVSVLIPAPLERVWEAASDLGSHSQWMTDASAISFRSQQRQGVGTTIEVLTRIGPLSTTDVIEVTAWEPPRRIEVRHLGLVSGTGEFRLDPVAGGVLFSWSEHLRFPWRWGGPLGAVVARPILRLVWQRNLRSLRARMAGN